MLKKPKTPHTTAPSTAESETVTQEQPAKKTKVAKPAKQKMIRDSFTLPANDYANLSLLKTKCLENGVEVKKSELVRAGLIALSNMPTATLVKAVSQVERIKTGRPKGN